jgi:hypothetical protein
MNGTTQKIPFDMDRGGVETMKKIEVKREKKRSSENITGTKNYCFVER